MQKNALLPLIFIFLSVLAQNGRAVPLPTIADDSDILVVKIGDYQQYNELTAWPAKGLANRPLLIAAHGNGGSAVREIKGWLPLARQKQFTIVCPTFISSASNYYIPQDREYFAQCLAWIKKNLKFDSNAVFMTGFSGGGSAVWYQGMAYPNFFKGVMIQSGNFSGEVCQLYLHDWKHKPIRLIWGANDSSNIIKENQAALNCLRASACQNFSHQIVPNAGHQPQRALVVKWMEALQN